jgi:hypothetical protein
MTRKLSSYNKFVKKFSSCNKHMIGPKLMKAAGAAWRKIKQSHHKKSHLKKSRKRSYRRSRL